MHYIAVFYITNTHSIQKPTQKKNSCRFSQQPYKVYSSKVTKLNAATRSRELIIMAPLAVPTVGVLPTTSGRWQQGTGWLFGLQISGAR